MSHSDPIGSSALLRLPLQQRTPRCPSVPQAHGTFPPDSCTLAHAGGLPWLATRLAAVVLEHAMQRVGKIRCSSCFLHVRGGVVVVGELPKRTHRLVPEAARLAPAPSEGRHKQPTTPQQPSHHLTHPEPHGRPSLTSADHEPTRSAHHPVDHPISTRSGSRSDPGVQRRLWQRLYDQRKSRNTSRHAVRRRGWSAGSSELLSAGSYRTIGTRPDVPRSTRLHHRAMRYEQCESDHLRIHEKDVGVERLAHQWVQRSTPAPSGRGRTDLPHKVGI
jgi:hypothetical protein